MFTVKEWKERTPKKPRMIAPRRKTRHQWKFVKPSTSFSMTPMESYNSWTQTASFQSFQDILPTDSTKSMRLSILRRSLFMILNLLSNSESFKQPQHFVTWREQQFAVRLDPQRMYRTQLFVSCQYPGCWYSSFSFIPGLSHKLGLLPSP